jgi:MoaA/NifB/PqqE/SkfB family radical SAM enzyme
MPPTGQQIRVLQIHPSRRCNLRCAHCYSSSSPDERDGLDTALLRAAIFDAAGEQYNVASFSGGEPLLYPSLRQVLEAAHEAGMLTTVTTNGMLLDARRVSGLVGGVDLLAISLDGRPGAHNRIRGSPRAFESMASHLGRVRGAGLAFGFIFTLTRDNVDDLVWAAQFATEQGARLLQIHPLEEVGRAAQQLAGAEPDDEAAAFAWLIASQLRQRYKGRLRIQLDLVDAEMLCAHPTEVYADPEAPEQVSRPLSELVTPLVIEADGTVVPLQYGFARRHALGSLLEAPLRELAARWRREQHPLFRELCRRTFLDVTRPMDLPFINWYREVARSIDSSREPAHPPAGARR